MSVCEGREVCRGALKRAGKDQKPEEHPFVVAFVKGMSTIRM